MPASLVVDGYAELIPKQLIDHLLLEYLEDEFPLALTLLSAVGLVRETVLEDEGNRPGSIQHAIAWHDIPQVLANPRQLFVDAYGWTRDDFDASVLLESKNRFYDVLFSGAGSDTLSSMLNTLHARIWRWRALGLTHSDRSQQRSRESIEKLKAMVHAIEARDGDAAERITREEADNAALEVIRLLSSQ